jgi:hypothetical protein
LFSGTYDLEIPLAGLISTCVLRLTRTHAVERASLGTRSSSVAESGRTTGRNESE